MKDFFDQEDVETDGDFFSSDDLEQVQPEDNATNYDSEENLNPTSQLESAARGSIEGATFGFGDEIGAAVLTPLESVRAKIASLISGTPENVDAKLREQGFTGNAIDSGKSTYQELRDTAREANTAAREDNPWTYGLSEVAGGIIPSIATGGGVAAANVAKSIGKETLKQASKEAAITGAKYGAAAGLGYSEADSVLGDVANTALGGVGGAITGAALPVGISGAKSAAKNIKDKTLDVVDFLTPGSDYIKAGYNWGKQGNKVNSDTLDKEVRRISVGIQDSIKKAKSENNMKDVKGILDKLGVKIDSDAAVNEAIKDMEKIAAGDTMGIQNKDILNNLKKLVPEKKLGYSERLVGDIEADKARVPSKLSSVSESEDLRTSINLMSDIEKNKGASADPLIKRARKLASSIKDNIDDKIRETGDTSLIEKRQRFNDIYSAEDMLGINKRTSVKAADDAFNKANKLGSKLAFNQGHTGRNEVRKAYDLLGNEIITPETKKQLALLRTLNELDAMGQVDNVSRAGLYKKAVGDLPNLIGRTINKVQQSSRRSLSPIKATSDILDKISATQLSNMSNKLSQSSNKGISYFGNQLAKASSEDKFIRNQAVWALSQSPAFREMLSKELSTIEEDTVSELEDQGIDVERSLRGSDTTTQPEIQSESKPEIQKVKLPKGVSRLGKSRIQNLKEKENFEPRVYKDSLKFDTIGYGHKITEENKASGKIYGIDYKNGISKEQADKILAQDTQRSDSGALKILKDKGIDVSSLSEDQLDAIRDMTFQLGNKGASDFTKTFNAIKDGNFEEAAKESARSDWNTQTPERVKDFQERIQNDKQPEEESIKEIEQAIDGVNQMQGSGDGTPVDQIDNLLGKIDQLNISQEDKDLVENEAINMVSFSDGNRLKDLIRKIQGIQS